MLVFFYAIIDCLLLILSFLTGWYVCNRYHDRDRLVEGSGGDYAMTFLIAVVCVIIFVAAICAMAGGCHD